MGGYGAPAGWRRRCLPWPALAASRTGGPAAAGRLIYWFCIIRTLIVALAVATAPAAAETLYEEKGVALEGTVRIVTRGAATCQVREDDDLNQGNHGRPLHVWRVDYGAFNGSGQPLAQLTAHFRIDADWPPCTNWTGLGQYPGPVQWAGSFETLQRTGGLEPGGEARETLYLLAIDGEQPQFRNWQLDFRFGETTTTASEPVSSVTPPAEPEAARVPQPTCDFDSNDKWFDCWYQVTSPVDCYAWRPLEDWHGHPEWTGECVDGLANGPGGLVVMTHDSLRGREIEVRHTGTFRDGKKHGAWVETYGRVYVSEGSFVDGSKHGRWRTTWPEDRDPSHGLMLEQYEHGERTKSWFPNR